MVRSEGNVSLKNPVTPPGIDPGTFRLVAQHLNHCATTGLATIKRKNPVTPPGINPGTVRLVAQRLNHYATPGSVLLLGYLIYKLKHCFDPVNIHMFVILLLKQV